VTEQTTFSISPNGLASCTGASCTAAAAGDYTVTGDADGRTATAELTVTGETEASYVFEGFFAPIHMSNAGPIAWNGAKAGQSVPAKWRLTLNGQPVSDPDSFTALVAYPVSCDSASGSIDEAVPEPASGKSGLEYQGDGVWKYNWKTPKEYKGTCRTLAVRLGDGTTSPGAHFTFK
jgi:hypothetical protein